MTSFVQRDLALSGITAIIPLLVFWGIRLIVKNAEIAKKKAIRRSAVTALAFKLYRLFRQTEDDIDYIRAVTVWQGVAVLFLAAFLLLAVITAVEHPHA